MALDHQKERLTPPVQYGCALPHCIYNRQLGERSLAVLPNEQNIRVHQTDVDESPEHVLPPTSNCTPHTVVGAQLIHVIDTSHQYVESVCMKYTDF